MGCIDGYDKGTRALKNYLIYECVKKICPHEFRVGLEVETSCGSDT